MLTFSVKLFPDKLLQALNASADNRRLTTDAQLDGEHLGQSAVVGDQCFEAGVALRKYRVAQTSGIEEMLVAVENRKAVAVHTLLRERATSLIGRPQHAHRLEEAARSAPRQPVSPAGRPTAAGRCAGG
jgi:hypothetical protein